MFCFVFFFDVFLCFLTLLDSLDFFFSYALGKTIASFTVLKKWPRVGDDPSHSALPFLLVVLNFCVCLNTLVYSLYTPVVEGVPRSVSI